MGSAWVLDSQERTIQDGGNQQSTASKAAKASRWPMLDSRGSTAGAHWDTFGQTRS